jgi:hypothetical protein
VMRNTKRWSIVSWRQPRRRVSPSAARARGKTRAAAIRSSRDPTKPASSGPAPQSPLEASQPPVSPVGLRRSKAANDESCPNGLNGMTQGQGTYAWTCPWALRLGHLRQRVTFRRLTSYHS